MNPKPDTSIDWVLPLAVLLATVGLLGWMIHEGPRSNYGPAIYGYTMGILRIGLIGLPLSIGLAAFRINRSRGARNVLFLALICLFSFLLVFVNCAPGVKVIREAPGSAPECSAKACHVGTDFGLLADLAPAAQVLVSSAQL